MTILTASELATYAPDLALTGAAATALIYQVQIQLESAIGRPLELTSFSEKLPLTWQSQTAQLSYIPIQSTPTPAFKIRGGNVQDGFDRAIALDDWVDLLADDYILDNGGLFHLRSLRVNKLSAVSLLAAYTAGLEFTQSTPEITSLKYAFGRILSYAGSISGYSGVAEYEIKDRMKVKFAASSTSPAAVGAGVGQIPAGLLSPFLKYRPRESVV